MRLSDTLNTLDKLAKDNKLSVPYIVGGLPRDKIMGVYSDIKDIDITTGNKDSFALGMVASREWPKANFRTYSDGHSSLDFKNIRIDFSSNWNIPNIEKELEKIEMTNLTDLQKEIYSRDFTINTFLQPMDLSKKPLDITGQAYKDAENKYLRTPIDPELTIGYDFRRILRALKLSLKMDLKIDPLLKKTMIKYRGGIGELPLASIKKQVNQMLKIDAKKTLDILTEYKLLPIIPLSRLLTLEVAKNRMVQHLLEG